MGKLTMITHDYTSQFLCVIIVLSIFIWEILILITHKKVFLSSVVKNRKIFL